MIRDWITNNLNKTSIALEAGACHGTDTAWLAQRFQQGMIYSFEPIPALYEKALAATKSFKNVELSRQALSNTTGRSVMYVSDRFGVPFESSSLLAPKDHLELHTEITFKSTVEVETINLDDWFKAKSLDHIDLMWLDMQGAEPIVLRSAPTALSKTRYLYTEISLMEVYEDVIRYPEFKTFLENNNFETVFEDILWADQGNVLFKNKS